MNGTIAHQKLIPDLSNHLLKAVNSCPPQPPLYACMKNENYTACSN